MFGLKKFLQKTPTAAAQASDSTDDAPNHPPATGEEPNNTPESTGTELTPSDTTTKPASSWFTRLSQGLKKTRQKLFSPIITLALGKKEIDQELLNSLETTLLLADVGLDTTQALLREITRRMDRQTLKDPAALIDTLKQLMIESLLPCEVPLTLPADQKPFMLLVVGVNGAGKTTSIAKLAHFYQQQGQRVMLAAGDTFRAAAIEQLQTWGTRHQVPVVAQKPGADSASVIFDAMQSASARHIDLLIADTAGRLHTQSHLMDELAKIKRVAQKQNVTAPHEIMLILDASQGQNALNQAKAFHQALNLSSISITKLDGTAKGGILFSIAKTMGLPIRFIGVGEGVNDLKPFEAKAFVEALFETTDTLDTSA